MDEEPSQKEELQDAVVIDDKKATAEKASSIVKDVAKRNKASIHASLAGAGIGLIFAMLTKKNKYLFTAIGAVAGYAIGDMYSKQTQNDNKSKT